MFNNELTINKPKPFTLLNKNYVIWKTDNGNLNCTINKCSHRGAKLSDGIIRNNCIECPYHGWQFNGNGKCKFIPQVPLMERDTYKPPKSCNIKSIDSKVFDDIVWVNPYDQDVEFSPLEKWNDPSKYLITDYPLDVSYNFALQIENLLDPAHLHFVHDGFQGNRNKASAVFAKDLKIDKKELSARFVHENKDTPQIIIKFHIPSIVEVSIMDKKMNVVRKNIIYVSPSQKGKCRVLFRDIAVKKYLTPEDNLFVKKHVNLLIDGFAKPFIDSHYQLINQEVVMSIMKQDIDVLMGQQENIGNYFDSVYTMPTESDRLIVEFRKWIKNIPDRELFV
jgi:phenylpropionate dioxygenase-like ring-hydroxylating dioxygenase large terminal subunit